MDSSSVALIVAAMDLKLVQLIRGAMRAADMAAGGCCDQIGGCPKSPQPTPKLRQDQYFVPTPRLHATPRIEPRPVIYPKPRVAERPAPLCPPVEPEKPRIAKSGLQAPWQMLPAENPAPVVHPVKLIKVRPDIAIKGSMIDCFM